MSANTLNATKFRKSRLPTLEQEEEHGERDSRVNI